MEEGQIGQPHMGIGKQQEKIVTLHATLGELG